MRKFLVLSLAVAIVLSVLLAWSVLGPVAAQEKTVQAGQRWEYKVASLTGVAMPAMEESLNRLGAEGWELCTTPQRDRTAGGMDVVVFKRPKR